MDASDLTGVERELISTAAGLGGWLSAASFNLARDIYTVAMDRLIDLPDPVFRAVKPEGSVLPRFELTDLGLALADQLSTQP